MAPSIKPLWEGHLRKRPFDLRINRKSGRRAEGYERGLVEAANAPVSFEYVPSGGSDPQQLFQTEQVELLITR